MISVIIPTYNRTHVLISRALPSVFAQTMQDFEVLVVGDGTEQATVGAMEELATLDKRVRFWNLPHYAYPADFHDAWGLYGLASLNHGLDEARGEWIAVLADDDEWTPDHLEVLLAASEDADHVYGISDTYKDGEPTGQLYGAWPPGSGQFCNGANIYRAFLGYRYDLSCRSRGMNGDEDMWARMIADGVRFRFVPRLVLHYHRNFP